MRPYTRRELIRAGVGVGAAALAVGIPSLVNKKLGKRLSKGRKEIPVRVCGPSMALGHRLRDHPQSFAADFLKTEDVREVGVVIVGGGIAGLSAAWSLHRQGYKNFVLLELEAEVGGNSAFGENQVSSFPWGAHYVPLLNPEMTSAITLFEDLGVITGQKNGLPIYNDYFLCQAPQERLFVYGKWQEGFVPQLGLQQADEAQVQRFFSQVQVLRERHGRDGRRLFNLPLELSSRDPEWLKLDNLTMAQWLKNEHLTSPWLRWYVNYCCRDDFGTRIENVSAWAGLHYFCARHGKGADLETAVVTWPEGNGWLVRQLRDLLRPYLKTGFLVTQIQSSPKGMLVDAYQTSKNAASAALKAVRFGARKVILCTPRFVASRLLPEAAGQSELVRAMSYAPWLVANLTLKNSPAPGEGAPMSWDNVLHDSPSLGYVVATHQRAAIHTGPTVWTYYLPLDGEEPAAARQSLLRVTPEEWRERILLDLEQAHPEIRDLVQSIDLWYWGHGMIRPTPGYIWGKERSQLSIPWAEHVHFAHSDMSGLSLFEEAHFQGVRAASEVLSDVG